MKPDCPHRGVWLWLIYAVLLLWVAMPQGYHTALETYDCRPTPPWPCSPGILTPLSTNADIIRLFTTADAGFIAQHAKTYAQGGGLAQATGWPLWPPGMIALETLLYDISPNMPVGLVLILLSVAIWAAVLAQMSLLLAPAGRVAAFFLPLVLPLMPEWSYFFHRGLFYTESLSVSTFLLGVGLLLQAVRQRNAACAGWAGAALAFSAYMRAQTDMVMSVTLVLFLTVWLLVALICRASPLRVLRASAWLGSLALALVSYHALTLPYRAAHHMQWIDTANSPMWPPTWERKRDITPELQFYVDGGGVEACEADPKRCNHIYEVRKLHGDKAFGPKDYFHFTVASVLEHPFSWALLKWPYLVKFWMEVAWEGTLLTALLALLIIRSLRGGSEADKLFLLLLAGTALGILGPLLLTHFESRYLYQFKLLILYLALLVSGKERMAAEKK